MEPCDKAPEGWYCTRELHHDGPCAAVEEHLRLRMAGRVAQGLGAIAAIMLMAALLLFAIGCLARAIAWTF